MSNEKLLRDKVIALGKNLGSIIYGPDPSQFTFKEHIGDEYVKFYIIPRDSFLERERYQLSVTRKDEKIYFNATLDYNYTDSPLGIPLKLEQIIIETKAAKTKRHNIGDKEIKDAENEFYDYLIKVNKRKSERKQ